MIYRFGDYVLDAFRQELRKDGSLIALEPKSYRMLVYFVASGGRLIDKHELLQHVWQGVNVDDTAVRRCIRNIRRALGENRFEQGSIETQHGRGYRFLPEVIGVDSKFPTPVSTDFEAHDETETKDGAPPEDPPSSLVETAILLSQSQERWQKRSISNGGNLPARPEVFLDATFGAALAIRSHPEHQRARELADEYRRRDTVFVTTRTVLLEVAAQVSAVLGTDAAFELLDAAEDDPSMDIVSISDELYIKAKRFAERHGRKGQTDDDVVVRYVMHQRDIEKALSPAGKTIFDRAQGMRRHLAALVSILLICFLLLLFLVFPKSIDVTGFSHEPIRFIAIAIVLGCVFGFICGMAIKKDR